MKTAVLIGFFLLEGQLTFGYSAVQSEFACQTIVQEVEDGAVVHLTNENGEESPPLLIAICVDPEKRAVLR
jgi:hypothetical protein